MVVPSREVAVQIKEQIEFFGSSNNIRCVCVIGGTDYIAQKKALEDVPHIVVGTPGRMYEQFSKSEVVKKYLGNVDFLVLDEADHLMNETLEVFVRKILNMMPEEAQIVYSSATINDEDLEKLEDLKLEKNQKKLVKISCHRAIEKAKSVTLRYCFMPAMIKECYLVQLLKNYQGNDVIVFFNNCE